MSDVVTYYSDGWRGMSTSKVEREISLFIIFVFVLISTVNGLSIRLALFT